MLYSIFHSTVCRYKNSLLLHQGNCRSIAPGSMRETETRINLYENTDWRVNCIYGVVIESMDYACTISIVKTGSIVTFHSSISMPCKYMCGTRTCKSIRSVGSRWGTTMRFQFCITVGNHLRTGTPCTFKILYLL